MTSFASQLDYLVDAITANPQIVEQALVGLDPAEKLTLLAQIEEAARRRTVARAADDLASYCRIVMPGFEEPEHILRMIDAMERIEAGALKRLIVAMPPRMGKTQLTGILFPSWYLGRRGGRDVIFTTYAQELANDRGRAIKEIMNGDAYAGLFPGTKIRQDTSAAQRFRRPRGTTSTPSASAVPSPVAEGILSSSTTRSRTARRPRARRCATGSSTGTARPCGRGWHRAAPSSSWQRAGTWAT